MFYWLCLSFLFVSGSAGQQAVVFDVDATLTPCLICFLWLRKGAVDAINLWKSKGYEVVVVTSRPDSPALRWITEKTFQ